MREKMLAKWALRSNEEQSRISQIIINKFDFDHKDESKKWSDLENPWVI